MNDGSEWVVNLKVNPDGVAAALAAIRDGLEALASGFDAMAETSRATATQLDALVVRLQEMQKEAP